MITLITGVPGAGKTLYCVDQILQPEAKAGRQLFVDGIPDLLVNHEPAPDPMDWPTWAPQGAHIVIDEVQRVWRPESAGKAIPPSIAELETHRHRGLDFTIMTQHPNLIHSNVRRLVGRHIHVRRTALGVVVYEWSECKTNPDTAWRSALTKLRWKHPKSSFGLYKSASIHQKVKFRLPKAIWLIIIPLFIFPFAGYFLYSILSQPLSKAAVSGGKPQQPSGFVLNNQNPSPSLSQPSQPANSAQPGQQVIQAPVEIDIREQFIPRVSGQPETAPAYDNLRVVKSMPRISACMASETTCVCYTEQATPVDMSESQCREHLERRAYDPYRDAAEPRTLGVGGSSTVAPPVTDS